MKLRSILLSVCTLAILCAGILAPSQAVAQDECPCFGAVFVLPGAGHIEDFESEPGCSLDGLSCSLDCNLSSSDWSQASDPYDAIDWTVDNGGTPTTNTGPSIDATLGTTAGNYAYLESSCPDIGHANKAGVLYSKCLNVTAIQAPELSFSYHMYGEDSEQLAVEISTDNCLSWTPVFITRGEQQASSGDAWKTEVVNLVPWAGLNNLRVRIVGLTGGSEKSDIAIDDIIVREAPSTDLEISDIISPTNGCVLTNQEPVLVQIENNGFNPQTGFDVSYLVAGGFLITETFSGTIPPGGSAVYNFNTKADLSAVGPHLITATASVAGDSRPLNDSLSETVVNIPVINSFPYVQDFEAGAGGWLSGGTFDTWGLGAPNKSVINSASSGVNAWVTGGILGLYKNNEQSFVTGPCFDFGSLDYPVVDLNVWWNAEGEYDGAVLQSSIDGGNSWQNVGNYLDQTNWYNQNALIGIPGGQSVGWSGSELDDSGGGSHGWLPAEHSLNGLGGEPAVQLRVAFGSDPIIRDDGFAFDDVVIRDGAPITKVDSFIDDQDGNGRANVGDIIKYTVQLMNESNVSITGLIFDDTPDASTSLINGTVTTTTGTVLLGNGGSDTDVRVNVGSIPAGAGLQITFQVSVGAPANGSSQICNQGFFVSNAFNSKPTDDPAVGGLVDSTCIAAYSDSDGDGVPDGVDQCPGFDDNLDGDGDGVPDDCDLCPADSAKSDPGSCGCGNPDTDTDSDGTADCIDSCPSDPNKTDAGACGCGVPDTDSDSDGTPDCTDGCPSDSGKTAPGVCGCGTADTDSDGDGTPDCNDNCPNDSDKTDPGVCGCGVADTDTDGDGPPDCIDSCPGDAGKTLPGVCGCGTPDTDSDGDGTPDCNDECANDPAKTSAGVCGCGVSEEDTDGDGTPECVDGCPNDPAKAAPGVCGCGVADTDSDGDGLPDCIDGCVADPNKGAPGVCGCGSPDTDSDGDGTADCTDGCPNDPAKTSAGTCGCGVAETDSDGDGVPNCNDNCPNDSNKTDIGACGCGNPDTDTDGDGAADCIDGCPADPVKTSAGICGCGTPDTDSDGDGPPDCIDNCPNDPNKLDAGICGCGVMDIDGDGDGTLNCDDGCPNDSGKVAPGVCGCGTPDIDSDGDGTPNCNDQCSGDPNKTAQGACGCGEPDTDSDGDGVADCNDLCLNDPTKSMPGVCGCGNPDDDTDGDGAIDCQDSCPSDPNKTVPGLCGCGNIDGDADNDAVIDCQDGCPEDPSKSVPGVCGCGIPDFDSDNDGVADCQDGCFQDAAKTDPGVCGCGIPDVDGDGDGAMDCQDECPLDPAKQVAGSCGCGAPDADVNANGVFDCFFAEDFNALIGNGRDLIRKVKKAKGKKAKQAQKVIKTQVKELVAHLQTFSNTSANQITLLNNKTPLEKLIQKAAKFMRKALKTKSPVFKKNKKKANRALRKIQRAVG